MARDLLVDPDALREQVREKYREVAVDPGASFHFHTGRGLASRLGYEAGAVDALPDRAVESFAGVGNPFALRILLTLLRPGVPPSELLLHPVGRAAWVGLFATALNLLPGGQLDGGHILYAAASKYHKRVTLMVAALLFPLGFLWYGWFLWGALLLGLGLRHPPLLYQWESLDRRRLIWTGVAVLIFILKIGRAHV